MIFGRCTPSPQKWVFWGPKNSKWGFESKNFGFFKPIFSVFIAFMGHVFPKMDKKIIESSTPQKTHFFTFQRLRRRKQII